LRNISIFNLFLLLTLQAIAQPNLPENGHVYTADEIPKVYITIDVDSLEDLYLEDNWYSDHEYPASFAFESQGQTDVISLVGFRFRGNTSRDKIKKSFKVSFNTFVQGQKYFGLEKLNLNAETNDPAMMRSRLCWDLFRDLGVPAPRSNHVEVYINDDYYGLYLNTEHIDEEFAELRFGSQGGNLYKCSYPADLGYLGNDPENYKVAPWGTRTYELKTNTELDDYSDLAEFIGFLNQTSDQDLECGLNTYFNVYSYLKVAAIDVLTGNWDGYIYNQNNFYLYHNPTTDQFEYIPYDTDNTWGIDWLDRNWSNRNLYNWSQTGATRPLFNRLMDVDQFRDIFSYHIDDLLQNHYFTSVHQSYIGNLQSFIEASALADPYRPLDWGFDDSAFLNALDEGAGGHVDYGVLEFAEIRKSTALDQLEFVNIASIPLRVKEEFDQFPSLFSIEVFLEGPDCLSAELNYTVNGVQQETQSVSNPMNSALFEIELPMDFEELSYNVSLSSGSGANRTVYCDPRHIYNSASSSLVINELMSSNDLTISDEAGDFNDWIELYNPTNTTVELGDYFLSDNSSSPTKWHFPEYTMQPGEFLLVWADRDLNDGPFHANFRLSAGGEEVLLFKAEPDGIRWVDGINFPTLPTDFSYGREDDAQIPWVLFSTSTPGASNSGFLGISDIGRNENLVYPNPVSTLLFFGTKVNYKIESIEGRNIAQGVGEFFDASILPYGVYIVRFNGQVQRFVKQ
jgi:spore coat protein CotH